MSGNRRRSLAVGVLGGMGPEATVDFMTRVLAATPARVDQEHIRMLVDHNPGIPDRHAAIAGTGPDIGPELAAMARGLEAAGADFLVMVCNTAHAYTEAIRTAVSIPFVSIVDVVMAAIVGAAGLRPTQRFMTLLWRIKAGERGPEVRAGLQALAASLEFAGAELLLAGCTEIPLVLEQGDTGVKLLSSTDLLVRHTVALALAPTIQQE